MLFYWERQVKAMKVALLAWIMPPKPAPTPGRYTGRGGFSAHWLVMQGIFMRVTRPKIPVI